MSEHVAFRRNIGLFGAVMIGIGAIMGPGIFALPGELAGGGYSFTSRTLPRPLAFFTGWFFWIGNALAFAMYALIFTITMQGYFWPNVNLAVLAGATTLTFTAVNL